MSDQVQQCLGVQGPYEHLESLDRKLRGWQRQRRGDGGVVDGDIGADEGKLECVRVGLDDVIRCHGVRAVYGNDTVLHQLADLTRRSVIFYDHSHFDLDCKMECKTILIN